MYCTVVKAGVAVLFSVVAANLGEAKSHPLSHDVPVIARLEVLTQGMVP